VTNGSDSHGKTLENAYPHISHDQNVYQPLYHRHSVCCLLSLGTLNPHWSFFSNATLIMTMWAVYIILEHGPTTLNK
jgi:hypothetical protein